MSVGLSLQGSQLQSLSINAQIIQSIALLQLNQQELQTFIHEELERNPLLEMAESAEVGDSLSSVSSQSNPSSPNEPDVVMSERDDMPNWREGRADMGSTTPGNRNGSTMNGEDFSRDMVAASISLREHLHRQISMSVREMADRPIAVEIIESLDDDGYLRTDVGVIADVLGVSDRHVEAVLRLVQTMDPAGVGARDIRECLSLQLTDPSKPLRLLLDHLDLVAQHDYRRLATLCGVETEEIVALIEIIRALDPKPGYRFSSDPVIPAIPDIAVELRRDGTFVTSLITSALPRVLINQRYYSEVKSRCKRGSDARFVSDCFKSANWLIKNLDRRANTILKVATAIVAKQRDFLLYGPEHLKPLNLRDVAEEVGVHQSTVSRTIANKYMMTNRGLFELKFFFTNAIAGASGDEGPSADTVRHMIKRMISGETAETVLSDDAIVGRLREAGVDIARRTVAKYREGLRIPSSLQRRRQRESEALVSRRQTIQPVGMKMCLAN